jgi:Gluconate 2-dehydrogenase subunit 3
MQRRELLIKAGWMAAAGALWTTVRQSAAAESAATPAIARDALIETVCDLVIPDTDTPGAKAARVPAFIELALQHGLAGSNSNDRQQLEGLLNAAAGGAFIAQDHTRQLQILTDVDAQAYAMNGSVWPRIKTLVLMGYYTSEVGASQELQYQLVPGRYDADLPVKAGDRGWSSDWVGQSF